ncbi:MAG: hypothetical protein JO117_08485 [Verrucomicrobia bacterium]|nr:hypothetical protein [Verrucomicrobiota bacterium]
MAWIKENYDRFLLALAALGLLVCAVLLFLNARSFQETFKDLQGQVVHSTKVPEVDVAHVAAEGEKLKNPDQWQLVPLPDGRRLPLFASIPYIIKTGTDASGNPSQELSDPITDPNPLHPPIPNKWFFDHKLDVLALDALTDDPDGDGFTNLEEFQNNTDPTDKNSHPPYVVKLYFRRFEQRPFRLVFSARVGQTIQLNPRDLDASTLFVKVGDMVRGSPYKVVDFKEQSELDPSVGIKRDTSVVTLENTETKERIELPKEKEINSPDSIAHLQYTLGAGKELHLKKNAEFSLSPEDNVKYRLTDVTPNEATITRVSDGKVFKLPLTPAAAPAQQ